MRPTTRWLGPAKSVAVSKTRDLVLAVMRTTATKREARQYVSKYNTEGPRRVSLVRLGPGIFGNGPDNKYMDGIGRTINQMMELGSLPIVLLSPQPEIKAYLASRSLYTQSHSDIEDTSFEQAQESIYARCSDFAFAVGRHLGSARPLGSPFELSLKQGLEPQFDQIASILNYGMVPVIAPVAFDDTFSSMKFVQTEDALVSLVRSIKDYPGYTMDKIIFIDDIGGLPSLKRGAAHVHVNIAQELGEIAAELHSNVSLTEHVRVQHLANLNAMNRLLGHLKSSVTGIITTPASAAAGLSRNPILYNILTDRPLISPSLPMQLERTQLTTSVLRRGMPVKVHYDAKGFNLTALDKIGEIDLAKLVNLIEKSFGRKLDVEHYLNRINDRIAAIIIVGDYDGAAIITWETSPAGMKVAYLDKLAVHPQAQGAAGVADILFNRMIRHLFPEEIIWRSGANNPVNKWYFERARGFLRLPESPWVMFWHRSDSKPPLDEYNGICSDIEPSLR